MLDNFAWYIQNPEDETKNRTLLVIGRIKGLFVRYSARHLSLTKRHMTRLEASVTGSDTASAGAITSMVLENHHLSIFGVCSASEITAENAVSRRILHLEPQSPPKPRTFELRLPFDPGETRVAFNTADDTQILILPKFSRLEMMWGNIRLVPIFRKKSAQVFKARMANSGAVVVTHSPEQMRDLCTAGAVLEDGKLTYFDNIEDAIALHHHNMNRKHL